MSHGIAISQESLESILSEFRRRDERIEARYKMVFEQMMTLAPLLFAHGMFGTNKDVVRDPMVERFLATLTPEQIDAITKTLGIEQSGMLLEIAQRYVFVPPVDPNKDEQK